MLNNAYRLVKYRNKIKIIKFIAKDLLYISVEVVFTLKLSILHSVFSRLSFRLSHILLLLVVAFVASLVFRIFAVCWQHTNYRN